MVLLDHLVCIFEIYDLCTFLLELGTKNTVDFTERNFVRIGLVFDRGMIRSIVS